MEKFYYLRDLDDEMITVHHNEKRVSDAFQKLLEIGANPIRTQNDPDGKPCYIFRLETATPLTTPQRASAAALARYIDSHMIGPIIKDEDGFPPLIDKTTTEKRYALPWRFATEDRARQAVLLIDAIIGFCNKSPSIYREPGEIARFSVAFDWDFHGSVSLRDIERIAILLDRFDVKPNNNKERIDIQDDFYRDIIGDKNMFFGWDLASHDIARQAIGIDTILGELLAIKAKLDAMPPGQPTEAAPSV